MKSSTGIAGRILWPLALFPLFWMLAFLLFLFQIHAAMGHWPLRWETRGNDFTQLQDTLLFLDFLVSPVIALAAVVLAMINWKCASKFPLQLPVTVLLFGAWFSFMVLTNAKPVAWFFDCW